MNKTIELGLAMLEKQLTQTNKWTSGHYKKGATSYKTTYFFEDLRASESELFEKIFNEFNYVNFAQIDDNVWALDIYKEDFKFKVVDRDLASNGDYKYTVVATFKNYRMAQAYIREFGYQMLEC